MTLVQSIKKSERTISVSVFGRGYRVCSKKGIYEQYWVFDELKDALYKFNLLAELFE